VTTEQEILPLSCGGCLTCPACVTRAVLLWTLLSGKLDGRGEWKGREQSRREVIMDLTERTDAAARAVGDVVNRAMDYGAGTRAMGAEPR
jgi:hypothetical protein